MSPKAPKEAPRCYWNFSAIGWSTMSADFGAPDCGCLAKRLSFVRTLPGKRRLAAAKMPVSSRWTIEGPSQVQTLDDAARRELKHGANQIGNLFVRDRTGVEGVDHNRDRLGYSDPDGQLHPRPAGQLRPGAH